MSELNAMRQREQQEAVAAKEREMARIAEERAALQAEMDKTNSSSEVQVCFVSSAGRTYGGLLPAALKSRRLSIMAAFLFDL